MEKKIEEKKIEVLRGRASRVAATHKEYDEAATAADDARVEVLERVVEAVRPALLALSSKYAGGVRGVVIGRFKSSPARVLMLSLDGTWMAMKDNGIAPPGAVSPPCISTRDVLREWRLDAIVDSLAVRLEAHEEGNALKRAEQLREKAEKLRAIATMLSGMK